MSLEPDGRKEFIHVSASDDAFETLSPVNRKKHEQNFTAGNCDILLANMFQLSFLRCKVLRKLVALWFAFTFLCTSLILPT